MKPGPSQPDPQLLTVRKRRFVAVFAKRHQTPLVQCPNRQRGTHVARPSPFIADIEPFFRQRHHPARATQPQLKPGGIVVLLQLERAQRMT